MKLLKDQVKVKLQDVASKILMFAPVCNGYVYITVNRGSEHGEHLVHIDHDGKKLWQKHYQDSLDVFGQFNDREVIVLNPSKGFVEVVDVTTHEIKEIPHQFAFEDTSQMDLITFPDTKYFCVQEKGAGSDNRLFLTYYHFGTEIRKVAEFRSEDHEGMEISQSTIRKLNNHSRIGWYQTKQEEAVKFTYFDLKESEAGRVKTVSVRNTMRDELGMNNLSLALINLWETTPDCYLMVCNSNRLEGNIRNNQGKINNNYILDEKKAIIRETRFNFPDEWNIYLIDYLYVGAVSIFRTFKFENGGPLDSPVFFVNNEREEIIPFEETWKSSSCYFFYVPGYDNSTMVESFHTHGDVTEVDVSVIRLVTYKEVYLHFLLHLNEDFDDDLLKDAVELLED